MASRHYPGPATPSGKGYEKTGDFRPPRRGEFYLSGAIPQAWQAPNDLSTPYYILRPVELHTCPTCSGVGKVAKH